MKVNAIGGAIAAAREQATQKTGEKFAQVQAQLTAPDKQSGPPGLFGPDLNIDLTQFQERVLSGKSFTPQELIVYQVKANQFNLRVELLSKTAETAVSTLKRFQNPQ